MIDTGSVKTILSSKVYDRLPQSQRFFLRNENTDIYLADGSSSKTRGTGETMLRLGSQELMVSLVVADIADEAILGMDLLSQAGASLDVVQGTVTVNGETIDCHDSRNQLLSYRCMVRRSVIIEAHSEVVFPVTIRKRRVEPTPLTPDFGLRILEPCNSSRLQDKGLVIARTLVNVGGTSSVPARILNLSDEPQVLQPNTVIALAKPVHSVREIYFPEDVTGTNMEPQQAQGQGLEDELPEPLRELVERGSADLNEEEKQQVVNLLIRYKHVFSMNDWDLGTSNDAQHHINTGSAAPIRQRPRRAAPWKQAEIDRQVNNLLTEGKVQESNSPWASPVVLVTKKDGSQRLCVDYRQLNSVTVKDAFPLPRIDDSLDCLSGAKWFSTLDMASGYWQVGMDPTTKHKAAFATSNGLFEWNCMPFGLTNSPGTFERLITLVLKGLQFKICLCYLDDVIVFAQTFREHLQRLEMVLVRFASAGLKLKPRKCNLFQHKISYLGHVVTEQGVTTDPAKVERVLNWPVPESATEVKSFLGLATYYRRFVPGFASIARPLYQLTEPTKEFEWTNECQHAFDKLKELLTSSPVLAYPKQDGLFILDTDASNHGIGAVLSQVQDGVERPIAYSSRTLSKSERNYCTTRRELLAIVEFTKLHRHYLQGSQFLVRTDHAPLRSILATKDPEGQLARWISFLSTLKFNIEYREGKRHNNADALSRRPCDDRCKWCQVWKKKEPLPRCEVGTQTEVEEELIGAPTTSRPLQNKCEVVKLEPMWTTEYLKQQQSVDPILKTFIELKKSAKERSQWPDVSDKSPTLKALWSQWDRISLQDGVLCRRWESDSGDRVTYQIVLPESLRETALKAHHNHTTASHRGVNKTLSSLRQRYYWPGLTSQTYRWVTRCHDCGAKKTSGRKRRAPLKQYVVGAPLERIAMDILGPLPLTTSGNRYVLVVTDYFTKWTEGYAIPDQTAPTVAEKLVSEFICRFGVPRQLHSDQGTNFESKVMAEVCKLLDIEKTRTTPLHPQSDGQVERYNRTLIEMLRGKLNDKQEDWDLQLPTCMMAYRSSVHESTGSTPNELMLGREIEVPLDAITEFSPDTPSPVTDYAQALHQRLATAHECARQKLKKAAVRQKRNYDKKMAGKPFQAGDSVWLHQVRRKKGRNPKLDCPWEGPYLVTAALSDVVYRIQKSQRAKPKVVHSDRLKPYLGPPLKSWISACVPPPLNESEVVQSVAAPEQVVVDDGVIQSSPDGEPSIHHSDVESEASVEELEDGEDDVRPEQEDGLQNAEVPADCGATESSNDGGADMAMEQDPLAETVVEGVQRGQGRRRVKAPERFGEWVNTLKH